MVRVSISVDVWVHNVLTGIAEAYRMNRRMTEDPMANYVDKEL